MKKPRSHWQAGTPLRARIDV